LRGRNLEAQIKIQKELSAQLIKAAGLAAVENPQAASQNAPQTSSGFMDTIDKAFGFFVMPAYGQDDKQRHVQGSEEMGQARTDFRVQSAMAGVW
jgi:hypothetical protein